MKKNLLAVLVAGLLSTSAMATTVYEKDGTNVDVYGRFSAAVDKSRDTKFDLKDDESRFGLKVKHNISGSAYAIGGVEFRFSDATGRFADPKTHEAYAGIGDTGIGTLTFGRQATVADELALSKYAYLSNDITMLPKSGDRTVKFRSAQFGDEKAGGAFSFGVDYTFLGSNAKDQEVKSSSVGGGLFYSLDQGDFGLKVNAGLANTRKSNDVHHGFTLPGNEKDKNTEIAYLVGGEVRFADLSLAVDYSKYNLKTKYGAEHAVNYKKAQLRSDAFQVAVKYAVTPETNVFTSYQYGKTKNKDLPTEIADTAVDYKYDQFTLGADYKLHKNVVTYAQVNFTKGTDKLATEDRSTKEVGGAFGFRVLF